jgi:hypothetical protein
MADNDDGKIRWSVVGAVVMQSLSASGTMIGYFEVAPEHASGPAGGAAGLRAAQQREQHGAFAG